MTVFLELFFLVDASTCFVGPLVHFLWCKAICYDGQPVSFFPSSLRRCPQSLSRREPRAAYTKGTSAITAIHSWLLINLSVSPNTR